MVVHVSQAIEQGLNDFTLLRPVPGGKPSSSTLEKDTVQLGKRPLTMACEGLRLLSCASFCLDHYPSTTPAGNNLLCGGD